MREIGEREKEKRIKKGKEKRMVWSLVREIGERERKIENKKRKKENN